MQSSVIPTNQLERTAEIAIVGGGPAASVLAIALARRGIRTTVFERDAHPEVAPRFNPGSLLYDRHLWPRTQGTATYRRLLFL